MNGDCFSIGEHGIGVEDDGRMIPMMIFSIGKHGISVDGWMVTINE